MLKTKFAICVAVLMAVSLVCLCGCGSEPINNELPVENEVGVEGFNTSYGVSLPGYYVRVVSDVSEGDKVVQRNFYVCTDEEMTKAVGTLTASYGENEELTGYEAVIGVIAVEKLVTYSVVDGVSSFYSEINFSAEGITESSSWKNIVIDSDAGETATYIGTQSYYSDGSEHVYREEKYVSADGGEYLESVTEREYDESGKMISENITNYDKDGNEL